MWKPLFQALKGLQRCLRHDPWPQGTYDLAEERSQTTRTKALRPKTLLGLGNDEQLSVVGCKCLWLSMKVEIWVGSDGVGASQVSLVVKNPPANAGDTREAGSVLGSERFPGRGHGNPLQYSCMEKLRDRRAWQALRLQRVRHDWSDLACRWWRAVNATALHVEDLDCFLTCNLRRGVRKVLLHGRGRLHAQADYVAMFLGGYSSSTMGSQRDGHDWDTLTFILVALKTNFQSRHDIKSRSCWLLQKEWEKHREWEKMQESLLMLWILQRPSGEEGESLTWEESEWSWLTISLHQHRN